MAVPLLRSVAAMLLAASTPAFAQLPEPTGGPSARDLYVGCSLMLRMTETASSTNAAPQPWSATTCARVSMDVFFHGGPREGEPVKWCPAHEAGISVENWRPMVQTFLDYFERHGSDVADRDGRSVYLEALRRRWPCPS